MAFAHVGVRQEGAGGAQMKRLFTTAALASLVPLSFWLAGYDFNERGGAAVACLIETSLVALGVWSHQGHK